MSRYLESANRFERMLFGVVFLVAAGGFVWLAGYSALGSGVSSRGLLFVVAGLGLAVTAPAAIRVLFNRPRADGELIPVPVLAGIGLLCVAVPVWLVFGGGSDWRRDLGMAAIGLFALAQAYRRTRSGLGGA